MEGQEVVLPESTSGAEALANEIQDEQPVVVTDTKNEVANTDLSKSPGSNAEQTIGQQRMRTSFNPAQNSIVDQIKQKTAELIDLCESIKHKDGRLGSLAQTTYEEAGMWAVKLATA